MWITLGSYLDVAVSTGDDVDAVSVLLVLQDTGVVFGSQNEQKIFALTLKHNTDYNNIMRIRQPVRPSVDTRLLSHSNVCMQIKASEMKHH